MFIYTMPNSSFIPWFIPFEFVRSAGFVSLEKYIYTHIYIYIYTGIYLENGINSYTWITTVLLSLIAPVLQGFCSHDRCWAFARLTGAALVLAGQVQGFCSRDTSSAFARMTGAGLLLM